MAKSIDPKVAAEKVDTYFAAQSLWVEEQKVLRSHLSEFPFSEAIKWGIPTYSYDGRNLVGIGAFKSYFGLWFFGGAELSDPGKVLINAQPGKTKMMRQWRMTDASQINDLLIKSYLAEVIELNS